MPSVDCEIELSDRVLKSHAATILSSLSFQLSPSPRLVEVGGEGQRGNFFESVARIGLDQLTSVSKFLGEVDDVLYLFHFRMRRRVNMRFSYHPATRIVAICLGLAVIRAYVVASPPLPLRDESTAQAQTSGQRLGQLIIRKGKNITVNGVDTSSGATILTDSRIQTPADVGATIILKDLATIDIGPNTELVLDFSGGKLNLQILKGCTRARVKEGVNYSETTPMGEPVQKQKDAQTICVGAAALGSGAQNALPVGAGAGAAASSGGLFGFSLARTIALLGVAVAAVTTAIVGTRNNQEEAPVISPIS